VFAGKLADEGLLVRHWPKEHGGGDGLPWEHFILGEEVWGLGEPRGAQYMNVNWIGPALMYAASPEQQAQHLPAIARGDVIWCQLFSEPSAGSDLAAMRTRAERVGNDRYIVNGMKMWTSYGRVAEWGVLLAKTGEAKKEISVFLVKMDTPGITIKPFPGLVEDGHLHEIFFDNVEIPAANLVGQEGQGWDIVRYALNYERVGVQRYEVNRRALDQAVAELKRQGRFDDPHIQRDIGAALAASEACRLLCYDVADQRARGLPPNADASLARMSTAETNWSLNDLMATYLPEVMSGEPVGGDWHLTWTYQFNIASTIVAGAYEVQCDIVATQALGLPRA
jgi:alkylation response protein AidB-like acyl-CoA dehydrogenase